MAYEMGRHIIGYEVQKVLAAVDWFTKEKGHAPVGMYGYFEGSEIALAAAACDPRIAAVSADLPDFPEVEPLYRNRWAFIAEFDAEGLLKLIYPRKVSLVKTGDKKVVHPRPRSGRTGAAPVGPFPDRQSPGRIDSGGDDVLKEPFNQAISITVPAEGQNPHFMRLTRLLGSLGGAEAPRAETTPKDLRGVFDPADRQHRQFDQLVAFTQKVWRSDSEATRAARFAKVDFSSPKKYEKSIEPIRKFFDEEVIGKLPAPTEPTNPKTRELYDTPKWKGYEVTLDLYPDVYAYGILLLPKDLKPGEKRPVVVCQHGLEGRPQDVCNPKERTKYYNSFGAQLADLGYIVYAPQNPYIGQDKFRVLQRKANPLKLSLFSFIVRQHERALDWLATLPNVDDKKMAFYGLSYGGKTAMRVPAILPQYCLSICSGDFNEWVGKNVSVDYRGSYMFSPEYEMPEFDLGMTFNYAEMAYLIAPRPFMVERGHDDGVGIDEMIAYEYAKVRYHYAKLKLPERTEIEFFDGHHEIHGVGTFAFLKKHLGYPR
jgi:cephalosporin-C deacetylase-like acetyl esterase